MITGQLVGDAALIKYLETMPTKLRPELRKRVEILSIVLQSHVKQNKLSGQALNRRTGTLSRSIARRVEADASSVQGIVGTNIDYAGIHEFGGKTKPHIIEAKNAAALRFTVGGKTVFAKRVNHPGSKMPERSFLRSSLADLRSRIEGDLEGVMKAVADA